MQILNWKTNWLVRGGDCQLKHFPQRSKSELHFLLSFIKRSNSHNESFTHDQTILCFWSSPTAFILMLFHVYNFPENVVLSILMISHTCFVSQLRQEVIQGQSLCLTPFLYFPVQSPQEVLNRAVVLLVEQKWKSTADSHRELLKTVHTSYNSQKSP